MTLPHRGFTLIELLVVLAILGAVTTLALRSASKLQERTSFESTQRALEVTAAAIVGDGNPDEPGFLGDMGRMPLEPKVLGETVEFVPEELWSKLPPVEWSGIHPGPNPDDPEIVALTGWRGPYLQLPPLENADADTPTDTKGPRHLDGYGNEVLLRLERTNPGTANETIIGWSVLSLGSKPEDPSDDIVLPLYVRDGDEETMNRLFTDLSGTVKLSATPQLSNTKVTVVAYGPDPIDGRLGQVVAKAGAIGSTTTSFSYVFDEEHRNRLTRGPWVVRAYLHLPGQEPQKSPIAKSDVHRLSLAPRTHFLALDIDVPGPSSIDDGPQDPKGGVKNSVPLGDGS